MNGSVSPRDDLRRLHFVNALFSQLTGSDLYLAQQIQQAIAFSLSELEAQMRDNPEFADKYDKAFTAAAAHLLTSFFGQITDHGFYHWDAAQSVTSATPLFARTEIMTGLKRLAPYRESTLLITNLRPALLPSNVPASPKRKKEYEDTLTFIRDLAAARTGRHTTLQLLFL